MSGRRSLAMPSLAGIVMLAAGLVGPLPTASAQDATTHVDTRLAYLCPFPSGEQEIEVHLVADLPTTATAGQPVRPSDLGIELTVPQAALSDLTARGAASLTAVARVGVSITHDGSSATTNWSGAETSPVSLPAEGDLVLPLEPARVVQALLSRAGVMTFTATGLSIAVTGYLPDGAVTDPPSIELSCELVADQNAVLAAVEVSRSDTPVTEEPPPGAVRVDEPRDDRPAPGAQDLPPLISPDCEIIESPPDTSPLEPPKYCAFIAGYTNITKLNASVLQPHSLVNIGPTIPLPNRDFPGRPGMHCVPENNTANIVCQQANIIPSLAGEPVLEPAKDQWLLPFGFVPTKATMQLTQEGVAEADIALHQAVPPIHSRASVTGRYIARVYDATVNGFPFELLGPNCRTVAPIEVRVTGLPGFGEGRYLLTEGGLLTGEVVIPPFTGCGVTEDLDPLLTGLISGPGNLLKLTQGPICTITGERDGCERDDLRPEPQR